MNKIQRIRNQFLEFTGLIHRSDKQKLLGISIFQFLFNLLDLIAIALIGIVGSIAASAVQGIPVGNRVSKALRILGIDEFSVNKQSLILSFVAIFLMSFKTLLSVVSQKKILNFLGRIQSEISSQYFSTFARFPISQIQNVPLQRVIYFFTVGVGNIFTGVIGNATSMFTEFLFLSLLIGALFYVDPVLAISTLLIFVIFTILLYKFLQVRLKISGKLNATLHIDLTSYVSDLLQAYREIYVRNAIDRYQKNFKKTQKQRSKVLADLTFYPYVSKYLMESVLIIGMFFVSAYQFLTNDARHSTTVLLIFLATSSRLAPSVIRLQQSLIQFRAYYSGAQETIDFLKTIDLKISEVATVKSLKFDGVDFINQIKCVDLFAKYPNSDSEVIRNINLEVNEGEFLAIVGPSGAGKSTLVDCLLGILEPSSGEVLISRMKPQNTIAQFPGKIAYVPQEVALLNDTILKNLTIGYSENEISIAEIESALEKTQLLEFVNSLPNGLQTKVGDNGSRLSGGQKQRLGIARAIVTNPEILILDEATSSLDGQTEKSMVDALEMLKGKMTVIAIAHRLSSLRNADRVIYLDAGVIRAEGSFDEVRKAIPDFDEQAKLMGIN